MDADRRFTPARKAQGFRSQAHIDAFFAGFDHRSSCPDCRALDGGVYSDDGYQPTMGSCIIAQRLDADTTRAS